MGSSSSSTVNQNHQSSESDLNREFDQILNGDPNEVTEQFATVADSNTAKLGAMDLTFCYKNSEDSPNSMKDCSDEDSVVEEDNLNNLDSEESNLNLENNHINDSTSSRGAPSRTGGPGPTTHNNAFSFRIPSSFSQLVLNETV